MIIPAKQQRTAVPVRALEIGGLDRLSGGQRHYLTLWAVLQAPADLVLLDEPTNNLDSAGVDHLTSALRRLAGSGIGLVLVSHDHDFVDQVCDQVIVLQEAADVV